MQLLSLLSLLSVAVANPVHSPRACFPDPTSFVVSRFVAFTASTGPNDTSAVTFLASDSTTGISTRCQRESTPGAGISPADPDHWYPCANSSMEFLWTGHDVGVREKYEACPGYVFEDSSHLEFRQNRSLACQRHSLCVRKPVGMFFIYFSLSRPHSHSLNSSTLS